MGKYRIETTGGVYEIETDDAPAAQPAPNVEPVFDIATEIGKGALKGLGSTIVHGADLGRRLFGMEPLAQRPAVQEYIQPTNPAQHVGYAVEQGAEFLAPAGLVGKGARAIEAATAGSRIAPALNIAGRAGLEAGSAAGIAGLQTGGDPEAMRKAAMLA